jgi:hypothetical protein
MGWLIVVVVAVTALSGAAIGSTKGREWEGAVYGLFFSVFGLVVVAAMPPSPKVQRERDQALARAIVAATATATATAASTAAREPEPPVVMPSVTVALAGCQEVAGPTSTLTVTVEPGRVVVASCRQECDNASHHLVLTDEEADEACQRLRIAAAPEPESADTTGRQHPDLLIDWTPDETGGTRTLSFDWTGAFLDPAAIARWEAGDRPDEADCGTLYLTGGLLPGGELALFESALSECAHLALEWDAGRANLGYVRATLSGFGSLVDV